MNNSENHIPFFALTETHLSDSILDAEISINNYDVIRSDRTQRKQGGVALYLHHTITVDDTNKFSDNYTESVMTYLKKSKLIIIVIYRAPNTPSASFRKCLHSVETFINKNKNSDVLMMGDFNFRFLDWKTETINKLGIPVEEQDQASLFLNFTHKHLLTQVVQENTRNNISLIDLILTTDTELIHNICVEKSEMSDHDVVRCSFLHNNLQNEQETTTRSFQEKHPLDNLNLARANWTDINEELKKIDWDNEMSDHSVNEMYSTLEKIITNICSNNAPKRTRCTHRSNIPNQRLALIRKKKRLNHKINYRKYACVNFPKNHIDKLEKKKVEVELQIRESIKAQQESDELKAIEKMKTNPKMFFNYVKKHRKTASRIGPLADEQGIIHSDAKTKAELLQHQYTKVFSDPNKASTDHLKQDDEIDYPTLEDISFTEEDVKKAIDSIPTSAAPGPDKLPAIILKQCKENIAYPIYKIWRKSLDTGDIPDTLKEQGIVPIFKKGNKSCPANYRPVSLTSHLIKLFEKILRAKIVTYIEDNNILTNQQHGFRRYRSCLTQLLIHIDNILNIVGNENNVDVIYLDFAKAFDKVDHKILLCKLHKMGIQGRIYNWIKSFLSNRTQKVIVDGEASESAEVKSGVPQGTVLGPILFLLFINDIADAMEFASIQLFADDSKLTMKILTDEDHQKLQKDIDAAIMWSLLNNMELNKEKFQLMQYGIHNELKQSYRLDADNTLTKSTEIKDLGVTESEDLSWLTHITNISNDGKKFASWILRSFKTRSTAILQLFKIFVISKMEYAAPLWMPYKKQDIERLESIQRTFTSKLDNLEEYNYHERLQILKLYSLQRRRERFCIITMWKIANELHPNQLNLQFYHTRRFGLKCRRKLYTSKRVHIKTIQHNSFASIGPALFNCIPKKIKDKESLSSFKAALDKFLKMIPDKPPISGYPVLNGNSIVEWAGSGHCSLIDVHTDDSTDDEMSVQNHGDATAVVASCL